MFPILGFALPRSHGTWHHCRYSSLTMFYFSIRSEPSQSAEGGRTVVSQASFLAVVEYSYFDRVADVPCIEPTVQVSRTTLTTDLLYHHRHSYFLLFSDLIDLCSTQQINGHFKSCLPSSELLNPW